MMTLAAMGPSGLRCSDLGPQAEHDVGPGAADGVGHLGRQRHRGAGEGDAQGLPPPPSPLGLGRRPALDEHPLDQVHARAPEEVRDERVGRPGVELLGRGDLLQPALAHDGDAVAHRHRLDLVVRDVERRRRQARLQLDDVGPRLHAQRGVEVRQRLVHQEDEGLAHDGPGQRDPLALAARELRRLAPEQRAEAERLGRALDLGRPLLLVHAALAERELDVLRHRQVRVQRVALEDHGHVAVLGVDVVHDAVADGTVPSVTSSRPATRRSAVVLPQPDGAEQHQQLAVGDLEREVVDGGRLAEALGDPLEADLCQRAPFSAA